MPLFEQENDDDGFKPKSVGNFWNHSYIEHENNGDRNKNLSLNKSLNKIEPYLRDIKIDLQNSDTWKIYLIIEINLFFAKDVEEEWITL